MDRIGQKPVFDLAPGMPAVEVTFDEAPNVPKLAWVFDQTEIEHGTINDLAEALSSAAMFGEGDEIGPVYAVSGGKLVEVPHTTSYTGTDDNDFMHSTLTVTLPDGTELTAQYAVDGRS